MFPSVVSWMPSLIIADVSALPPPSSLTAILGDDGGFDTVCFNVGIDISDNYIHTPRLLGTHCLSKKWDWQLWQSQPSHQPQTGVHPKGTGGALVALGVHSELALDSVRWQSPQSWNWQESVINSTDHPSVDHQTPTHHLSHNTYWRRKKRCSHKRMLWFYVAWKHLWIRLSWGQEQTISLIKHLLCVRHF